MSSSDQPTGDVADHRPLNLVFDAREAMHEARVQLRTELMDGSVSHETRRQFTGVLLAYYDVLKEHRGEAILDPSWAERDIDWIDRWSTETVTRKREKPGTMYGTEEVAVSRLQAVSPRRLLDAANALDDIAKDLGFTADTPDHTPQDEWDKMDLVHLMMVRGQERPAKEVYDALDIETGEGPVNPEDGGDDGNDPADADN